MIFNSVKGEWVPWLATAYVWSEDHGELTFDIREGVRWSDGQPFGPKDIVFTFELMKRFRALDGGDIWSFLDSVEAVENRQVKFVFSRPFVPGLQYLAHQPIVAEHIWGQIDDPTMFANEAPVGTGPFTEVRLFSNQVYELARNPHYWQPGKPHLDALRFPAFPSNDQANAALLAGEIDWAGNFVPAIERIFVDRNPEHHHYWFPPVGT
ncbi:MAG: ABC transporter substrate-binding protein, partial [Myxococcota bacterium]|nr:ABC transporter substrate-binding protein [Myxococcota bacterium]